MSRFDVQPRSTGGPGAEDQIPAANPPPGAVRRVGDWAVGNADGHVFAVSRRCRHQLADLAGGTLDAEGCLVCPWHLSRYDVRTGEMVTGPHGFLFFHGPTPGYSQLVRAYSRRLRLRVGRVLRRGAHLVVEPDDENGHASAPRPAS